MEETICIAELLAKRPLKQGEAEKIKKLLEVYSAEDVQKAIEVTFQNNGKLLLQYAETVLKSWGTKYKKIDFSNLPDQELYENYLTIKTAFVECGCNENLVNAYISCTTEIACRYFDEKGLYNRKAREELLSHILKGR